jgi:hypothetical protein
MRRWRARGDLVRSVGRADRLDCRGRACDVVAAFDTVGEGEQGRALGGPRTEQGPAPRNTPTRVCAAASLDNATPSEATTSSRRWTPRPASRRTTDRTSGSPLHGASETAASRSAAADTSGGLPASPATAYASAA